jgi:hypothetical protein
VEGMILNTGAFGEMSHRMERYTNEIPPLSEKMNRSAKIRKRNEKYADQIESLKKKLNIKRILNLHL